MSPFCAVAAFVDLRSHFYFVDFPDSKKKARWRRWSSPRINTYISKIRLTETLSNLQYLISNGTRVHKYVTFIQINQHQLLLASLLTWRLGNYPASLLNLRCLIEQFKVQHTFFSSVLVPPVHIPVPVRLPVGPKKCWHKLLMSLLFGTMPKPSSHHSPRPGENPLHF